MMNFVNLLIYAKGNILWGKKGPYYDKQPVKRIKVRTDTSYEELLQRICTIIEVDCTICQVKLFHRHATIYPSSDVRHCLVPITDDDDVEILMETAQSGGEFLLQELYVHVQGSPTVALEQDQRNVTFMTPSTSQVQQCGNVANTFEENDDVIEPLHNDIFDDDLNREIDEALQDVPIVVDEELTDEEDETGGTSIHFEINRLVDPLPSKSPQTIIGGNAVDYHPISESNDISIRDPIPFFNKKDVGDGYIRFEEDFEEEFKKEKRLFSYDLCSGDEIKKGMRFAQKEYLICAVKFYHIKHHRDFRVDVSDKRVWSVFCSEKDNGCSWRLRACRKRMDRKCLYLKCMDGAFEVTRVEGPHTCVSSVISQDHPRLDSDLMSWYFLNQVSKAPDVKVSTLRQTIIDTFGYLVTRKKVCDAKKRAIEIVYGDWDSSYMELPRLLNVIRATNPGSEVVWQTSPTVKDGELTFQRVFWTFGPCINAFAYCRPIVSIDGTFLHGKYPHKLLIACSMDGANHIVPLAFALVDEESCDSWCWFLINLKQYVVSGRPETLCLISDYHSEIVSAIRDERVGWKPPFAQWRYCIRHMSGNFNKLHNSQSLKRLVTAAALQCQPQKFTRYMDELKKKEDCTLNYFANIEVERWTRAYDGGYRFGIMTTNFYESYNAILKSAMRLPIAAFVKEIFYNCNGCFQARRDEVDAGISRGETYTPWAAERLQRWRQAASKHKVIMSDRINGIFKIVTGQRRMGHANKGGRSHTVNINNRECTCKKWQIYRIPCSHAIAAMASIDMDDTQAVGEWYKWTHQQLCYQTSFHPLGDKLTWAYEFVPLILPDRNLVHGVDRPKSKRYRKEMDVREPSSSISYDIIFFFVAYRSILAIHFGCLGKR